MPTTHVQPLRSARTRLEYVVYGNGSEGAERRRNRDMVRALAMDCDFADIEEMSEFARRMRLAHPNRHVEAYEIRISWGLDELDPAWPRDVQRAMEYARSLADTVSPDTPVTIVAHGDGVGGCLHIHMIMLNVIDMETMAAIRERWRDHRVLAAIADELATRRGMKVVERHTPEGAWELRRAELESEIESELEKVGDGKWSRKLRDDTVALHIGNVIDETIREHAMDIRGPYGLEAALKERGVGIIIKAVDGSPEGWTYTAEVELEGKTRRRRCKASKISREYCSDRVMEVVAEEAERQLEAQRLEQQRAVAAARQQEARRQERERQAIEEQERIESERRAEQEQRERAAEGQREREAREQRERMDRLHELEAELARVSDERQQADEPRRQEALAALRERADRMVDVDAKGGTYTFRVDTGKARLGGDWDFTMTEGRVLTHASLAADVLDEATMRGRTKARGEDVSALRRGLDLIAENTTGALQQMAETLRNVADQRLKRKRNIVNSVPDFWSGCLREAGRREMKMGRPANGVVLYSIGVTTDIAGRVVSTVRDQVRVALERFEMVYPPATGGGQRTRTTQRQTGDMQRGGTAGEATYGSGGAPRRQRETPQGGHHTGGREIG